MKSIFFVLTLLFSSFALAGGNSIKVEFETIEAEIVQSDTVLLEGSDIDYPSECTIANNGKVTYSYKSKPRQAVRLEITRLGNDFLVNGWYGTTQYVPYEVETCKVKAPKNEVEPFSVLITNANSFFVYRDLRISLL